MFAAVNVVGQTHKVHPDRLQCTFANLPVIFATRLQSSTDEINQLHFAFWSEMKSDVTAAHLDEKLLKVATSNMALS